MDPGTYRDDSGTDWKRIDLAIMVAVAGESNSNCQSPLLSCIILYGRRASGRGEPEAIAVFQEALNAESIIPSDQSFGMPLMRTRLDSCVLRRLCKLRGTTNLDLSGFFGAKVCEPCQIPIWD